jgi:hypothetical protein
MASPVQDRKKKFENYSFVACPRTLSCLGTTVLEAFVNVRAVVLALDIRETSLEH